MPFMPEATSIIMYLVFFIALAVNLYGLKKLTGQIDENCRGFCVKAVHALRRSLQTKFRSFFRILVLQSKTNEEPSGKRYHTPFFYGFVVLLVGTTLVALEKDVIQAIADITLLKGPVYASFEFLMDSGGILMAIGILLLLWRRYVLKPSYLHSDKWDYSVLALLLAIVLTGFLVEGCRIGLNPENTVSASYAGTAVWAILPYQSNSTALLGLYRVLWFFHMALGMSFIAVLPFTKLKHLFLIPINYVVNPPKTNLERAKLDTPFNIMALEDPDGDSDAEIGNIGIGTINELSWSEKLQFTSCINCGRCENVCPANNAGRRLSPRNVVQKVASGILENPGEEDFLTGSLSAEEMWGCTNCYACVEACPAFIRHVDHFLNFRRHIVNTQFEEDDKITLLSNMERNGNPYGLPSYDRIKWIADAPPDILSEVESPEVLYFIGCSSCYNPRCQEITDAVIGIMNAAKINFCVLGDEERCCGEPAKRIGEEGLFQMIAMQNIELFNSYGTQKILVHCPHCYNMIKHEYRDFGGEYDVVHHTELIRQLLFENRIKPSAKIQEATFSYHDPCNLGRLNGIYNPPREILNTFGAFKELSRNKAHAFCCGGGAGNAFFQVKEKNRIGKLRMDEAIGQDIDVLATACPFCMIMFDDAAGNYAKEMNMPGIKDIAEIVMQHISADR